MQPLLSGDPPKLGPTLEQHVDLRGMSFTVASKSPWEKPKPGWTTDVPLGKEVQIKADRLWGHGWMVYLPFPGGLDYWRGSGSSEPKDRMQIELLREWLWDEVFGWQCPGSATLKGPGSEDHCPLGHKVVSFVSSWDKGQERGLQWVPELPAAPQKDLQESSQTRSSPKLLWE